MNKVSVRILAFLAIAILCLNWIAFSQQPQSTDVYGGRGGSSFADAQMPDDARILEVVVAAGKYVDSVQMVYLLPDGRTSRSARHGGSGGDKKVIRFDSDEHLVGISGRYGDYIDSLRIHTNKRTSAVFGGRGGNRDFRIEVPSGNQAVGFAGRAGEYLDAIGLVYEPLSTAGIEETEISGGRGGRAFSDLKIPAGARISEIRVRSGDLIDSVQLVYTLSNGRSQDGPAHGGSGGRGTVFRLDRDEYLIGVSGRYGDYIDSLVFHTNKRTSPTFGGRGGNRNFRIMVPSGTQAIGFVGRAAKYLDAIGLTYIRSESSPRNYRWRRSGPIGR